MPLIITIKTTVPGMNYDNTIKNTIHNGTTINNNNTFNNTTILQVLIIPILEKKILVQILKMITKSLLKLES